MPQSEARKPAVKPSKKRGRKPAEKKETIKSVKEVFLGEFSLEDHMMKEAAQLAIKFRNSLH